jgi:hypothetical protein
VVRTGLEPATYPLWAGCSTFELPNISLFLFNIHPTLLEPHVLLNQKNLKIICITIIKKNRILVNYSYMYYYNFT